VSSGLLVGILGGSGLGGVMAAIVVGLFSKRKLGAEATEIITKAASGVVADVAAELERKSIQMTQMRSEHSAQLVQMREEHRTQLERILADHLSEMEEVRTVLQLHVAWDGVAIAEMARLGVELPPAPPLLPPSR
jgi:uncharacterized membrane protein YebE (DUF533 family)